MQGSNQGKSVRLWSAVLATSLLYAAAHPPWSLWPLALVAVAPASAVLLDPQARLGWRSAAVAGFFFGAVSTYLLVAHWSWLAASEFFEGSPLAAAGFIAALPLSASGIALYYAVLFVLVARLAGLGATAGVIGSAALWSAAEVARTSLGYGNPWGSFAAALVAADGALSGFGADTPVAGVLGLGGSPLVAFLCAAAGASLGLAWAQRHSAPARGRSLAAGAAVVVSLALASRAGLALLPLPSAAVASREPLRVALVQPGVGKSRLWQGSGAAESFARHVKLTSGLEPTGADLIVWPENALPFLLDANVDKRDELRALARDRGAALLVGGSHSSQGEGGRTSVFNSAFLFPADGTEPLVYDKRILLPFIEHVSAWAAPFLASPWQGVYSAGSGTGSDFFTVKGWRIAPLLCLEAIYPGEVAERVAAGADLLVNLTNDSWFDAGAGPEQHFALAMLAAAQTRRPLVRVATTGVSALVAENGLVARRLPLGSGTVALVDVVPPHRDSPFVRGGRSGFTLFLLVIAAAAAAFPVWSRHLDVEVRDPGGGELDE